MAGEWITDPAAMFLAVAEDEVIGCADLLPDEDEPHRAPAQRHGFAVQSPGSVGQSDSRGERHGLVKYILEMYKPKEKRRWGYFALPILHGDRLVGKLDATADRKAKTLVVNAIHEDVPFTKAMTAAVQAEIDDLATWLGFEVTNA